MNKPDNYGIKAWLCSHCATGLEIKFFQKGDLSFYRLGTYPFKWKALPYFRQDYLQVSPCPTGLGKSA